MPLSSIPSFNMFLQACAVIETAGLAMKSPHDFVSTYHDGVELGWVQWIFIKFKTVLLYCCSTIQRQKSPPRRVMEVVSCDQAYLRPGFLFIVE